MAIYFDDTFTGADDTLISSRAPDTGTGWAVVASGGANDAAVIKSNAAAVLDVRRRYRTTGFSGTPSANYEVIFEGVRKSTSDLDDFGATGPIARLVYDSVNEFIDGGYAFLFKDSDASNSTVSLYRYDNDNALTAIGSAYTFTRPGNDASIKLKIQVNGSSIKGLLDTGGGYVERCSATDSTHSSAGVAGAVFGAPFPSYTGVRCDRFTVQDISAGGGGVTIQQVERGRGVARGLGRGL